MDMRVFLSGGRGAIKGVLKGAKKVLKNLKCALKLSR